LEVASEVPNLPPTFTSKPSFGAIADELYTYQIEAADPENQTLTYDLLIQPEGMSLDATTGLLTWTPTLDQLGPHTVKVAAFDPLGLGASRTYTLTVREANQAPVLNNTPDTTALVGETYAFDLNVTDPDGDPVTYTLVNGPDDMTLDAQGRLRWTPGIEDVETAPLIRIVFQDEIGPAQFIQYNLAVIADTEAPQVAIEASANPVGINEPVQVQVRATDDVAIDEIGLTIDGTPIALDDSGTTTLEFEVVGSVALVATALDTSGNAASIDFSLQVIDPTDPNAPIVSILTPEYGDSITSFADVVGIVDETAFSARKDLDGEVLTPVLYSSEAALDMTEIEADEGGGDDPMAGFQARYEHLDPGQIVIIPAATALSMGGEVKALAVRAPGPEVRSLALAMADRFGLSLFSGEPKGTFLLKASDSIDYAGLPSIIVPVLIAALIVLNTMITSVYERKREIAVYTSLGMAPTHVSFLFVAEAVAFAVISSVLGYLLAQTAAKFLTGTPLMAGMTANYSSMAGVAAMLLVMAVVLLSVLYPSRVAAEIAIPDVNRSWSMPDAEGGRMEATLPFLVKYAEQHCIGGYLMDYYQAHEAISHGLFSSADVGYRFACPAPEFLTQAAAPPPGTGPSEAPSCLHLDFRTWLAPFDFGVKQRCQLIFCPSKVSPEFLEIKVILTREAGEEGAWQRINRGFLNDLRKQLLAWRSLTDEKRYDYEQLLKKTQETPA
jgi:hypothetical protein